jgi:hypothetical protein
MSGAVGTKLRDRSRSVKFRLLRARSVLEQLALDALRQDLDLMKSRVRQVIKQTRARIFRGNTRSEGQAPQPVRAIDRSHSQGQGRRPASSARW